MGKGKPKKKRRLSTNSYLFSGEGCTAFFYLFLLREGGGSESADDVGKGDRGLILGILGNYHRRWLVIYIARSKHLLKQADSCASYVEQG